MVDEMGIPYETFVTNVTFLWFLACVCHDVVSQFSLLRAPFSTNITEIWFFCMNFEMSFPNMSIETTLCSVTVSTLRTWISDIKVIRFDMVDELGFPYEAFATNVTFLWCLTCVCHDVESQITLMREPFSANIAGIWFFTCMSSEMITRTTLVIEAFTTVLTLELSLSVR